MLFYRAFFVSEHLILHHELCSRIKKIHYEPVCLFRSSDRFGYCNSKHNSRLLWFTQRIFSVPVSNKFCRINRSARTFYPPKKLLNTCNFFLHLNCCNSKYSEGFSGADLSRNYHFRNFLFDDWCIRTAPCSRWWTFTCCFFNIY